MYIGRYDQSALPPTEPLDTWVFIVITLSSMLFVATVVVISCVMHRRSNKTANPSLIVHIRSNVPKSSTRVRIEANTDSIQPTDTDNSNGSSYQVYAPEENQMLSEQINELNANSVRMSNAVARQLDADAVTVSRGSC